ncbi:toxin-antitoxin system, antitoxin component, Xre domain protein [Clostridiales bacterium KLE1615]|nr:toxin-antitoxin system, antitoxin component, Xre domain protein [Clostridiales bacterium KLE1615]
MKQKDGGDPQMTMAEQIIRARKKAGLTQRELAKQLNVTNKAVSRWETGVSPTKGY